MEKQEEKVGFDGKKVKILGPTFEEGTPEAPANWRKKIGSRQDKLNYLVAGERYWYSKEWYGSEKRKNPA
ncbi:MAG: hypothetical protein NT096_16125 [Proteobacteria bacterium]|jgi:hypothetical protein|nr:hypothetical protein [Pseudomonadota bacterium]